MERALGKYTSPEEVMTFPGTCHACGEDAETRMFVTKIPFFGEVIVMSNSCDKCGCKVSPRPQTHAHSRCLLLSLALNSFAHAFVIR